MGAQRYKFCDILAVLVRRAEELGQSPGDTRRMGIPYKLIGEWLRGPGYKVAPTTVLKAIARYEQEHLLQRTDGRPLHVRLRGNAWERLRAAANKDGGELDDRTPLSEWAQRRFLPARREAEQPLAVPAMGVATREKVSITLQVGSEWLPLVEGVAAALQLLVEEMQRFAARMKRR